MIISPFTSPLLAPLLSDEASARLFADAAVADAMVACEAALARASARCGLIPQDEAAKISKAAAAMDADLADLGAAAAANGPPVAALVRQLKAASGSSFVHRGATSQDIVDTAFVLQLRSFVSLADQRLQALGNQLAALAKEHRNTVMAGRTRWNQAAPITFGFKAANWLMPLLRQRQRLASQRKSLLVVQLSGAVGSLAWGSGSLPKGLPQAFAEELNLGVPAMPWQQQRDTIAEFASWLAILAAELGKISDDVLLLGQDEIREVAVRGGGSTAMPHKSNPVGPETVAALATFAASLLPAAVAGMRHAHERSGVAWQTEWLAVPTLAVAAGAALRISSEMLETLQVFPDRMRANIDRAQGLCLVPGYAAALAESLGKDEADKAIARAVASTRTEQRMFPDVLAEQCDAQINWQQLSDPASHCGACGSLVDQALQLWEDMP